MSDTPETWVTYIEHAGKKWVPLENLRELMELNDKLQSHIDKMSCCCSGCCRHNDALKTIISDNGLGL